MGGELIVGVEKEVGTFTDGNGVTHKRYVKVVDCGALPNNEIKTIESGIESPFQLLSISAIATSTQYTMDIPYISIVNNVTSFVIAFCDHRTTNKIAIRSNFDASGYPQTYVTLEYYK